MPTITRKRRIDASFDLTPLIDVVFQLLIFLMISSRFTKPESIVELPQTPGPAKVQKEQPEILSITLTADGGIELDGLAVKREDFSSAVIARVEAGTDRAKFRGDREAQYGLFVELMDEARAAGIESLGIVRQVESDGGAGAAGE